MACCFCFALTWCGIALSRVAFYRKLLGDSNFEAPVLRQAIGELQLARQVSQLFLKIGAFIFDALDLCPVLVVEVLVVLIGGVPGSTVWSPGSSDPRAA